MKNLVFSVYDSKAEMFNTPMFFRSKPEALRAFTDECNREGSSLYQHPADFTLFLVGDFDIETGKITPMNTPSSLGLAQEFKTLRAPDEMYGTDAAYHKGEIPQ